MTLFVMLKSSTKAAILRTRYRAVSPFPWPCGSRQDILMPEMYYRALLSTKLSEAIIVLLVLGFRVYMCSIDDIMLFF